MRGTRAALGVPVYRLPSTSPANAIVDASSASSTAWREVFVQHGLV